MPLPGVFLVGAGPGDVGLITVLGMQILKTADVVVYDALVNVQLLDFAPPHAQRIFAGKRAKDHRMTQDQINELLADKARQGLRVVRLKGGDPFLFGRGAEEAAYLATRGINCQVVPGITAGYAAPEAAGIPVTHRDIASTVTFLTGHENPQKPESRVDFAAVAALIARGGTACVYMGIDRLGAIASAFRDCGLPGDMPVAVVQWGTMPTQRSVRTTLADAERQVAEAKLWAPSIIVVGRVAALREPGLDGFTRRPLFGQTVVITRKQDQGSPLRELLAERGAAVLEAPTIEIVPPASWDTVDGALKDLRRWDWLILTSANAVDALADRIEAMAMDGRCFGNLKIGVVGDATAAALMSRLRLRADLVPAKFVAEALAEELILRQEVRGQRFLLPRADIARAALPATLKEHGGVVTELAVYHTRPAQSLPETVLAALRQGRVNWITFTSSSTANNMVRLLGEERTLLTPVKIASIGPVTSATVRAMGFEPAVEAHPSTLEGLVEAMVGN